MVAKYNITRYMSGFSMLYLRPHSENGLIDSCNRESPRQSPSCISRLVCSCGLTQIELTETGPHVSGVIVM